MNRQNPLRSAAVLILILLFCCGCGNSKTPPSPSAASYQAGRTNVLTPAADGSVQIGDDPLILDFSHADLGYFMGKLTQSGKKVNIQITGPDDVIYNYFLEQSGEWTSFPITAGNGAYLVLAYEDIGNGQYTALFSYPLDVTMENEFLPFLYPNQFVSFTDDSEAIKLAASLTGQAKTDLDALTAIYQYVISHIAYDYDKASSVESGYLPDIDSTLQTGTGICFDFASLTSAMLRASSIPTQLAIGYSGDVRHAWIDVYIESIGWVEHAVEFNGDEWNFMDPTFASTGMSSEALQEYIGDGSNYVLQYIR